MGPKKKPPPDNPANLAGRRRLARLAAWVEACGGIRIIVGPSDCKTERASTYAPPKGAREKYKKILGKKLKALNERRDRLKKPKAKPPHPPLATESKKKVSFFEFAKGRG